MEFASTYRNTAFLFTGFVAILFGWFGFIALIFTRYPPDRVMELFLWSTLAVVLGLAAVLLLALRVHVWTIGDDALTVRERPRVRWTGMAREATLPYAAIRAVEHRENGLDRYLDVMAGRRYRMPQPMLPATGRRLMVGTPDPDRDLRVLYLEIRGAARRAGVSLPAMQPRLGFFSSAPGLLVLGCVFLLCLALAVALVWAAFDGGLRRSNGEGELIALALPIVTGWLMVRCWRQRRAVLDGRRNPPA